MRYKLTFNEHLGVFVHAALTEAWQMDDDGIIKLDGDIQVIQVKRFLDLLNVQNYKLEKL